MYSSLANLFKDSQATSDDINLLLLGETGVGKSTLINSISNYLNYPDFKEAQKGNIDILIPMCLNVADVSKVFGNLDDNELLEDGKSATQHVKLYLFPIKLGNQTFKLRLIDTPGVGDPRGTDQDNVNLDNILAYLATLKKLHAICFVLKSNQTRFTKFVEYCLKQILTRLDKSASRNIIFITTYSKAAGYTAGETKTNCLMPLVNDIQSRPPHVSIPLSDSNIFALDNEAFKALLAIQEGKKYSKHELDGFVYSWEVSSKEIHRLLAYIIGDIENAALNPHEVENTISINEVRFLVEQLTTPIAEVSALLQDNIRILDRHKKSLSEDDQTLEQLKKQLHIPCVDLKVKNLTQPVTVCTDAKCADVVKVKQITQWHYKQRCHNPCLLNGIPREMIGDPGLIKCDAMAGQETCQQCGCHWKLHMHIYKETEKVQTQQEDQHVKNQIQTKQDARVQIQKLMKDINTRMTELEAESETISKIVAKFSYFLQEHALTPFNDAYSDYIEQLLKNERYLGKFADQDVVTKLEKLLTRHQHLQKIFQDGAKNVQAGETSNDLRLQGIKDSISELYTLKHMGKTIQELIEKSSTCRQKETQKNFSCKVAQEIVLDKKIAEEENESLYVPSYSVIYTFKSDDLEDDRSATPTTNFRRSGDSSRNPKGFENHQEPNSMQNARRSSSQNRFDHSRGYDIEYSGTRPTTQHSRNFDREPATLRRINSMSQHDSRRYVNYRQHHQVRENPENISPRQSHRSHHRMDNSPRRYRRGSESYDSDGGHSITSFSSRRSVSRSRDRPEKQSRHRTHHNVEDSPRHRHHRSDYYSDHLVPGKSSRKNYVDKSSRSRNENKSDFESCPSDRSVDSGGSVEMSRNRRDYKKSSRTKHKSSRGSGDAEEDYDTRIEKKSKHRSHKDSSRTHRRRSESENYGSDESPSSKNTVRQSRNGRGSKSSSINYDSEDDRPTTSSKSRHRKHGTSSFVDERKESDDSQSRKGRSSKKGKSRSRKNSV